VVVRDSRIRRDRLHPSLVARAVVEMEVWGLDRLGDQNPLLSERSEELGLPEACVKVAGLAVAHPVRVRFGQREVELVQ